MEIISQSAQATKALGKRFADFLQPGDTVGLYGELGGGKTTFISGLLPGLGYEGPVTSPTFTLIHEYEGAVPVFHFDCFRLRSTADFLSIGWDDYLRDDAILIVEWADRIADYFDRWTWKIEFAFTEDDDLSRRIRFWFRENNLLKNFGISLSTLPELKL